MLTSERCGNVTLKHVCLVCACPQESVDLGEIMFSLCYLPTAGRLTLTVIKCRNLKAMDITGYSGVLCMCDYVTHSSPRRLRTDDSSVNNSQGVR